MSPVAAPVAATRPDPSPRRPLASMARGKSSTLARVLPAAGAEPIPVAAFGSSV